MLGLKENEIMTPCIKVTEEHFKEIIDDIAEKAKTIKDSHVVFGSDGNIYIVNANEDDDYLVYEYEDVVQMLSEYMKLPICSYHTDNKENVWLELDNNSTGPYDIDTIKTMHDEDGYIHGIVSLHISDIIDSDFERFLDQLSIGLTGTEILSDINYDVIGSDKENTIFFMVSGNVNLILECED